MLKKLSFIFCITSFNVGCHSQSSTNDSFPSTNQSQKTTNASDIDGYYILSEYYDSIMIDKAIAKNSIHKISWTMFAIKIENDSIRALGLVYPETKYSINKIKDTLLLFSDFGEWNLFLDKKTGNILANQTKPYGDEPIVKTSYHFRKVKEAGLINLLKKNNAFEIRQGLTQLFSDSLLVGEYQRIGSRINERITFTTSSKIEGFKDFNTFHIHSYFGTYNPYNSNDAIFLESDDKKEHYNWEINGDSLKLTKFLTDDNDEFYKSKKSVVYRKIRKHGY